MPEVKKVEVVSTLEDEIDEVPLRDNYHGYKPVRGTKPKKPIEDEIEDLKIEDTKPEKPKKKKRKPKPEKESEIVNAPEIVAAAAATAVPTSLPELGRLSIFLYLSNS